MPKESSPTRAYANQLDPKRKDMFKEVCKIIRETVEKQEVSNLWH